MRQLSNRRVAPGRDRGAASAELAIAAPLLMLLLMAIVQFALVAHAHHIAQAAAARALAAARVEDSDAAAGRSAGEELLAQIGSGSLHQPTVTVQRTATEATADVRGTVVALLPFLHLPVQAHAAGPVEHLAGS
ncbi:TadE/TadG family type IV pilus assembly protein [Kitasatospora sp. NPDC001175]|uniref:TadE/TadG family type IV pilus assembly protein n=1 Tax=Kitasatospora sp. NPDC001175 TaxID=3157103 RepID=UPI003D07F903